MVETPLKGKVIDKVTVVIVAGKGETSKISGDKNGSSQGKLLDKAAGPPSIMTSLSWNCRGVRGLRTIYELLGLVSKLKSDFIFLMVTKFQRNRVESIKHRMGYEGFIFCQV